MRRINSNTIDEDQFSYPIESGGLGAMTLAAGAANIKLVTKDKVGQANGPIPLNSTGKIDSAAFPDVAGTNRVNLQGSFFVVTNETVAWTITDYDSFKNNTASATLGTISIAGNVITYKAPGSIGNETVVVNGRSISFSIQASQPAKPSITAPVIGATGIAQSYQFSSSAFAYKGTTDTHAASDWQLATDSAFTNIFASVVGDTVNKTTWTPTSMDISTTYYVRVRHKGTSGNYGPWSSALYFTTTNVGVIGAEEAILLANDVSASAQFGSSISMSSDGTRVAIGAQGFKGTFALQGKVYIFLRTGASWTLEASFQASDKTGNAYFGCSISMSSDGTRVAVGAYGAVKTYVFLRTGITWAQEAMFQASDVVTNNKFGNSVCMSSDGLRVIVGTYNFTGTLSSQGKAYVFLRTGTTWAQEAAILPSDPAATAYFGQSVSISADGSRVAVGARLFNANQGKAYVFLRTGTTWAQEAGFLGSGTSGTSYFGQSVSISADGSRVAVGASGASNTQNQQGKVFIFLRTGTTWAQEAMLLANDPVVNAYFGYSVSLSSDGTRVAVGAYTFTGTQASQGKAYVFSRLGTTWTQQSAITASNPAASDQFGWSVAISGDSSRVVVGSENSSPGGTANAGSAYVYR